jgi:hypothetical protein
MMSCDWCHGVRVEKNELRGPARYPVSHKGEFEISNLRFEIGMPKFRELAGVYTSQLPNTTAHTSRFLTGCKLPPTRSKLDASNAKGNPLV